MRCDDGQMAKIVVTRVRPTAGGSLCGAYLPSPLAGPFASVGLPSHLPGVQLQQPGTGRRAS